MANKAVIDFRKDPVYQGPCAIVAYACRENGNRPAKEFIEKLGIPDQAKLTKSFITIARVGRINNV